VVRQAKGACALTLPSCRQRHYSVLRLWQQLNCTLHQRPAVTAEHERQEHGLERQDAFDRSDLALNPVAQDRIDGDMSMSESVLLVLVTGAACGKNRTGISKPAKNRLFSGLQFMA
jgi:hypothetical protein